MISLAEQGKASFQQKQAAQAVSLYGELFSGRERPEPLASKNSASGTSRQADEHPLTEASTLVITQQYGPDPKKFRSLHKGDCSVLQ